MPDEITKFMNSELVKRTLSDNEKLNYYLNQIDEFTREWELYEKTEDTTIYYKEELDKEDASLTFGGESLIKAPMPYASSVLFEHELLHEWIPMLKSVEVLKEQSILRQLIHLKVNIMTPFSNRDMVCEGTGVILEEQKAFCFVMKSDFSDSYFGQHVDQECEGRVRMNMKHGFMHLQYVDENTCRFRVIMNVDMKINLAQGWVGKMVMNKVVKIWIYGVATKCKSYKGSEFAKRLIKNPLYRLLCKRLEIEFPDKNEVL